MTHTEQNLLLRRAPTWLPAFGTKKNAPPENSPAARE